VKRIAIALTFGLLALFLLSGCMHRVHGSGVRKTEKRDLPAFNAIETSGAFEVQVNCQQPPALKSKPTTTFCRWCRRKFGMVCCASSTTERLLVGWGNRAPSHGARSRQRQTALAPASSTSQT